MLSHLALLGHLSEEVAYTLQSHAVLVEIEAQREAGVGGLQADQAVDGGLHLGGIILMNLGAHRFLAIAVKLKKKWCWLVSEAEDG